MKYIIFLYSGNKYDINEQKTKDWLLTKIKMKYPNICFDISGMKQEYNIISLFVDLFDDTTSGTIDQYLNSNNIPLDSSTFIIVLNAIARIEIPDIEEEYPNVKISYLPFLGDFKNKDIKIKMYDSIMHEIDNFIQKQEKDIIDKIEPDTITEEKIQYEITKTLSDIENDLLLEQKTFLANGYRDTPFVIKIEGLNNIEMAIFPNDIELPNQYSIELHYNEALNIAMIMHMFNGVFVKLIDKKNFIEKTILIEGNNNG